MNFRDDGGGTYVQRVATAAVATERRIGTVMFFGSSAPAVNMRLKTYGCRGDVSRIPAESSRSAILIVPELPNSAGTMTPPELSVVSGVPTISSGSAPMPGVAPYWFSAGTSSAIMMEPLA